MSSPSLRVMALAGTRPEIIKLAPVVKLLDLHKSRFRSMLCVTGQHREMVDQVLGDFGLRPDFDLDLMTGHQALPDLSARVLIAVSRVIAQSRPDLVLVQGDTTSAAMGALAAFYARIPVAHVEAGLRTGDRYSPFPEEINRRLISCLAAWHYAPTKTAAAALLAEGIPAADILVTGNTVVDALKYMSELVGEPEPRSAALILVTAHRRESFGQPFEQLCLALRDLARRHPTIEIVYPVHRNPLVQETVLRLLGSAARIKLVDPMPYRDLVRLMKSACFVITDSGGIQEEAPVLGKPVLVMRKVTERPEGVAAGIVKLVGTDRRRIVREAEILLEDKEQYARMARVASPYGDGHAAERILEHLDRIRQGRISARRPPARVPAAARTLPA